MTTTPSRRVRPPSKFPLLVALTTLYFMYFRQRLLTWGSETREATGNLQGDDLIPTPTLQATRAITIHAPVENVWPWLAQMGRERTGFYGVDRFTNWNIPSVTYLRHDIPPLEVGLRLDNDLKVLEFVPNHYLLVGMFDRPTVFGSYMDLTCLYTLNPTPDGQTRLVVRTRAHLEGTKGLFYSRLFEIYDHLNTVQQLHGIRKRAESSRS